MAKKRPTNPKPAKPATKAADLLPQGYAELLAQLKERIRSAQLRAAIAANREMILLYWHIGREILTRQVQEGWGTKIIDRLAADLRRSFPNMTGLSPRNLKYMRAFCEAWPEEAIVQAALAQITWYHNIALLVSLARSNARNWGRSVHWIP
jgi:predicted nuclease of restriction endonuclease-like (RecB) superfamily